MVHKIRGRVIAPNIDGGMQGLIDLTSTSLTLDKNHPGFFVRMTNASAIAVTVPVDLPMDDHDFIQFIQGGAGAITVTGADGVTINATNQGTKATAAQDGSLHLRKIGANAYVLL